MSQALNRRALLAGLGLLPLGLRAEGAAKSPRLITLGGDVTEVVYLLGAEHLLVATDSTSLYPEAAQKTPKVGYFRQLSAEGLLSLKPDAIVAAGDAGPPRVLEQLRSAGVQVDVVPNTYDWAEVQAKLAAVGRASGREEAARAARQKLDAEWAHTQSVLQAWHASGKRRPRALFILGHGSTPSVAGQGTGADALIRMMGCDNAMQGYTGYRGMTAEGMASAAPDVLLCTQQGIEAQGGLERFWQRPGMNLIPAYATRRLLVRDALEMMGIGPRLPATVLSLHREAVGA